VERARARQRLSQDRIGLQGRIDGPAGVRRVPAPAGKATAFPTQEIRVLRVFRPRPPIHSASPGETEIAVLPKCSFEAGTTRMRPQSQGYLERGRRLRGEIRWGARRIAATRRRARAGSLPANPPHHRTHGASRARHRPLERPRGELQAEQFVPLLRRHVPPRGWGHEQALAILLSVGASRRLEEGVTLALAHAVAPLTPRSLPARSPAAPGIEPPASARG